MAIYKRGNIYHFKKRIPKALETHPFFYGRGNFVSLSLKTDSRRLANSRALAILAEWEQLKQEPQVAHFEHWAEAYRRDERLIGVSDSDNVIDVDEYRSLITEDLLSSRPPDLQIRLDALHDNKGSYQASIRALEQNVIRAKEAAGKSKPRSVISKVRRGCSWLLTLLRADDTDIRDLTWQSVNKFVQIEINNKTSSNTIHGYLYGLRQIWKHAYKLGLVATRESPFDEHDISNTTQGFDSFSWDEIKTIYDKARDSSDLQLAIKIASTTGARAGEICDIRRFDSSDFDSPLWAIKFRDKGKTSSATRLIPIHPTLAPEIPKNFIANWSYKKLIERTFTPIKQRCNIDSHDNLTGKIRRLGFHSFRVAVINYLVYEKGFPLAAASELTGHKTSYLGNEGAIAGYLRTSSLKTKLEMVSSIPWVFD